MPCFAVRLGLSLLQNLSPAIGESRPLIRAARILQCTFLLLGVSVCAVPSSAREEPASIPGIERPATFEALLANVKFTLDRGLLLRSDFFREDTLRRYFGGQRVTFSADSAHRSVGFVSGFDRIVEPLSIRGVQGEGVTFAFQRIVDDQNITTAHLTISISTKTDVNLQTIERIFGRGWRPAEARMPPLHQKYLPPTAPNGNVEFVYSTSGSTWNWGASFELAAGATLSLASFATEGKP